MWPVYDKVIGVASREPCTRPNFTLPFWLISMETIQETLASRALLDGCRELCSMLSGHLRGQKNERPQQWLLLASVSSLPCQATPPSCYSVGPSLQEPATISLSFRNSLLPCSHPMWCGQGWPTLSWRMQALNLNQASATWHTAFLWYQILVPRGAYEPNEAVPAV